MKSINGGNSVSGGCRGNIINGAAACIGMPAMWQKSIKRHGVALAYQ